MVSFYSIIQYVPDAARAERINIGVVSFGDGRVRPLFLDNWLRVKRFAGKDVSFLKEVAFESRQWDEATVRRLAQTWTGSIQITPPSASVLSPDVLLIDAGSRYLVEETPEQRGYRGKTDAVKIVRQRIREKLLERRGAVGAALIRGPRYALHGKFMAYEFDVSVGNGKPYFAAQGISFEVPDTRRLEKEISSTAWLIEDVKRKSADLPIGVLALPPREETISYKTAINMFRDLQAEVMTEATVSDWAIRMSGIIPMPQTPDRLVPGRLQGYADSCPAPRTCDAC